MAVHSLITALGGYDVRPWHIAVGVAVAAVVVVGGFLLVRRFLWPTISKWTLTQQLALAGAVVLVAAGGAYAVYKALDRPGDVLNEDVEFKAEKPEKKVVKTVNWPVYGYDDERTRFLPTKRVNPPFHSSDWSFQAGKLLEFSPIVIEGKLYLLDKDALMYSLDASNGKVLWKKDLGSLSAASPGWGDGRLFAVTLEPGTVQRIDPRTGKILWQKNLGARSETSPVVYGDKVIVGNESGTVFAFNVHNGDLEWTVDTAGAVKGGVALHDGVVYFGNYAGEVTAVQASNGDIKWQSGTQGGSFGTGGGIYSTPAVAYGRVYVGSLDSRVYSFDADNGDLAWSQSTGAEVYPGPAVAEAGDAPPTVYIGSADKDLYAMDARTGAIRWHEDVGGIILGAASVVGHVVYIGVIGPKNGTIGFNPKTGRRVFEHELGEYNPVISDGHRIYITGESGIRAFQADLKPGNAGNAKKHPEKKGNSKKGGAGSKKGTEGGGNA